MSNPNRPRKTTVSRGKKSDKKREKRLKQSEEIDLASNHDLGKVFAKAEENRKDLLINNNLTNTDKEVLFDPSPKFYEDTDQIRNINIKYDEVIININTNNLKLGLMIGKQSKRENSSLMAKNQKYSTGYKMCSDKGRMKSCKKKERFVIQLFELPRNERLNI